MYVHLVTEIELNIEQEALRLEKQNQIFELSKKQREEEARQKAGKRRFVPKPETPKTPTTPRKETKIIGTQKKKGFAILSKDYHN